MLFPWYLTYRQFYCRGRKKTAMILMGAAVLFFAMLCLAAMDALYPWDKLLLSVVAASVSGSLAAWLVQRKTFGPAPKRYYLHEWKNWISPICIAVFLGICLSVVLCFFPLLSERLQMYRSPDLLAKKVILWDFFRFAPYSLLFSLPVGIWWAGERHRFSSSHVLSYFFGLIVFCCMVAVLVYLYYFLLCRGQINGNGTGWRVLPRLQGTEKNLYFLLSHNYSGYFIMPLLLGTVARITDFWKRALAIFPALIVTFILMSPASPRHWQYYQNQIFYDMSSENGARREAAYTKANLLLERFPNHDGWPEIALKVARYRYGEGRFAASRALYQRILEKTKDSTRWYRQAALARAALTSDDFGRKRTVFALPMEPLRYESYMTANWMALLRNIRFFEGKATSEVNTLIKLKGISEDDKTIKLGKMPTLAELDDRAAGLGYSVLILPSKLVMLKRLIRGGFPVIQPIKNSFYLFSGIDTGRALLTGSNYQDILPGLKKADREGIADRAPFGNDNTASAQPSRVDILAYAEMPFSFWQQSRQSDYASHMAVVFPPDQLQRIVSILGEAQPGLQRQSKASLAALIGLSALNCGDVDQAVAWSQLSYETVKDPFPLHIAHLAELLWQSRQVLFTSKLQLDRNLPRLQTIHRFLADPARRLFLDLAQLQFNRDLKDSRLDWVSRHQYNDLLDVSDPGQRQDLIAITKANIRSEPDSRADWLVLASLFSWGKDIDNLMSSYTEALKAGPWDDELALKIAYLAIQQGQQRQAQKLIAEIEPNSVKYDPDYFYCLASLANWNKDFSTAKQYYRKAIEMRRYDSHYSLDYADMLDRLKEDKGEVKRLRSWVSRLGGPNPTGLDKRPGRQSPPGTH